MAGSALAWRSGFRSRRPKRHLDAARGWSLQLVVLLCWLTVIFVFGGTSRPETLSLIVLRPAAVLVLAFGLATLTRAQVRQYWWLFTLSAAVLLLHAAHLVPLPPEIWRSLPGRDLVAEIDARAVLGEIWRPLSLAPDWTWNSLWAFMVPLSVLVLGLQLDAAQRRMLLPFVLIAGGLSALLGLLQVLGDPNGPLYFYAETNNGLAVGLFANRNHQAVLLAAMIPILVVWAVMPRRPGSEGAMPRGNLALVAAAIGVAFLIPLILVTGSRAGLLVGGVAVLALPLVIGGLGLLRGDRSAHPARQWTVWAVFAGLAALILITIAAGRGLAFERLLASDETSEARLLMLPVILDMIQFYAPWGTGLGSFEPVFQVHEPAGLLKPTIFNRAHNDWAEIALTGGVPALILLGLGMMTWLLRAAQLARSTDLSREQILVGRLGLLVLLLLALSSATDYPVRMPSLSCLAAIAVLWAAPACERQRGRRAAPQKV